MTSGVSIYNKQLFSIAFTFRLYGRLYLFSIRIYGSLYTKTAPGVSDLRSVFTVGFTSFLSDLRLGFTVGFTYRIYGYRIYVPDLR